MKFWPKTCSQKEVGLTWSSSSIGAKKTQSTLFALRSLDYSEEQLPLSLIVPIVTNTVGERPQIIIYF